MVGDPTEGALIVAAYKAGLSAGRPISDRLGSADLEQSQPQIDSIPFESEHQYMASLHKGTSANVAYVKGSAEAILSRCQSSQGDLGEISKIDVAAIEKVVEDFARSGLRVLAFAKKTLPTTTTALERQEIESGLVFLGLQGMIDPPRKEAIRAVRVCQEAGIEVKMVTGDHVVTAKAIAQMMHLNQHPRVLNTSAVSRPNSFTSGDISALRTGHEPNERRIL